MVILAANVFTFDVLAVHCPLPPLCSVTKCHILSTSLYMVVVYSMTVSKSVFCVHALLPFLGFCR